MPIERTYNIVIAIIYTVAIFNFLINLEQNSLSQGQQDLDINSDVLMAESKVQDNAQNFITGKQN